MKKNSFDSSILFGFLIVLIVSTLLYLPTAYLTLFASRGEAREAVVVSDMIQQDNFILPLRNGIDIPSKPLLFHWLASGTIKVLGKQSEFAIRFPSVLCSILGLLGFYLLLIKREQPTHALMITLMLATTGEWLRSSTLARVDMVFTFFVGLTALMLFLFLEKIIQKNQFDLLKISVATIAAALATLAKGPAGVVFPWSIIVAYFILRHRSYPQKSKLFLVAFCSVLISVALAGSWYFAAYQIAGAEFLEVHLMRENVARLLGTKGYLVGHNNPFYFGILLLFSAFLPWSFFLPLALYVLWKKRKLLALPANNLLVFNIIWVVIFVIIFSISSSKRSVYLLPCLPATAYITAITLLSPSFTSVIANWIHKLTVFLLSLLGIAFSLLTLTLVAPRQILPLLLKHPKETVTVQIELILSIFSAHHVLFFIFAVASYWCFVSAVKFYKNHILTSMSYLSAALISIVVPVGILILPSLSLLNSAKNLMTIANREVPKDAPYYLFLHEFYPALYYSNRDIPYIDEKALIAKKESGYLIIKKEDLPLAKQSLPELQVIKESDEFACDGRDKLILARFGS